MCGRMGVGLGVYYDNLSPLDSKRLTGNLTENYAIEQVAHSMQSNSIHPYLTASQLCSRAPELWAFEEEWLIPCSLIRVKCD